MKKLMNNIVTKAEGLAFRGYGKVQQMEARMAEVLSSQSGEGFVDTALKILISVVVGALLLAGLYTLFKDNILPTLTQRITNLFNYAG